MTSDEHSILVGKRREQEPIDRLRSLPADKLVEAEAADFLRRHEEERQLAKAVTGVRSRHSRGQRRRCSV